jgi:hypothetical protein
MLNSLSKDDREAVTQQLKQKREEQAAGPSNSERPKRKINSTKKTSGQPAPKKRKH